MVAARAQERAISDATCRSRLANCRRSLEILELLLGGGELTQHHLVLMTIHLDAALELAGAVPVARRPDDLSPEEEVAGL